MNGKIIINFALIFKFFEKIDYNHLVGDFFYYFLITKVKLETYLFIQNLT